MSRLKARLARLQAAIGHRGRMMHGIMMGCRSRRTEGEAIEPDAESLKARDRLIDEMIASGHARPEDEFLTIVSFATVEPPHWVWSQGIG